MTAPQFSRREALFAGASTVVSMGFGRPSESTRLRRLVAAIREAERREQAVSRAFNALPGSAWPCSDEALRFEQEVVIPAQQAINDRRVDLASAIRAGRALDSPTNAVILDGRLLIAFGPEAADTAACNDVMEIDDIRVIGEGSR